MKPQFTFYSKVVNTRNHALIINQFTSHSNNLLIETCELLLCSRNLDQPFIHTCKHATPRFDHETLYNILVKLVNMWGHALIMKPRIHFIQTCEHAKPCFDCETLTAVSTDI